MLVKVSFAMFDLSCIGERECMRRVLVQANFKIWQ